MDFKKEWLKFLYGDESEYDNTQEFVVHDKVLCKYNPRGKVTELVLPQGEDNINSMKWGVFKDLTELKSVVIPEGYVMIGDFAFMGCTSLERIVLPSTLKSIGMGAFADCVSLKSIELPDEVYTIRKAAFMNCKNLQRINIPKKLKALSEYMFYNCESLVRIGLPDAIEEINSYVFCGCKRLESIRLPKLITVTGVGVFEGCERLKSVKLPEGMLRLMNRTFLGCASLESIKIPPLVSVIDEGAFEDCSSLSHIELPESLLTLGNRAFAGCCSFTELNIPSNVLKVMSEVFSGCTSLKRIVFNDVINSMSDTAFDGCDAEVEYIYPQEYYTDNVPKSQVSELMLKCNSNGSVSVVGYTGDSEHLRLPSYIDGIRVAAVENGAFQDNDRLKSVYIPDSVIRLGNSVFLNCTALQEIRLSNRLRSVGSDTFRDCTSLERIELPDCLCSVGSSVFEHCSSLCEVKMSAHLRVLGTAMFAHCDSLNHVDLPDIISDIGSHTFVGSGIISVDIPSSVEELNLNIFNGCSFLERITLQSSSTKIIGYSIEGCHLLKEIRVYPDNTNYRTVDGVLYSADMTTLYVYPDGKTDKSFMIPDGVERIYTRTFINEHLEKLVLPGSLLYNSSYGFIGFANLRELVINCLEQLWHDIGSEIFSFVICKHYTIEQMKESFDIPSLASGFAKGMYTGFEFGEGVEYANRQYIAANRGELICAAAENEYLLRYMLDEKLMSFENMQQLIKDNNDDTDATAMLLEYRRRYFADSCLSDIFDSEFRLD